MDTRFLISIFTCIKANTQIKIIKLRFCGKGHVIEPIRSLQTFQTALNCITIWFFWWSIKTNNGFLLLVIIPTWSQIRIQRSYICRRAYLFILITTKHAINPSFMHHNQWNTHWNWQLSMDNWIINSVFNYITDSKFWSNILFNVFEWKTPKVFKMSKKLENGRRLKCNPYHLNTNCKAKLKCALSLINSVEVITVVRITKVNGNETILPVLWWMPSWLKRVVTNEPAKLRETGSTIWTLHWLQRRMSLRQHMPLSDGIYFFLF